MNQVSLPRLLQPTALALLLCASGVIHAQEYQLNGLYVGTWTDKGRNRVDRNFSMRISQDGGVITGVTVDKTLKIRGRLVVDIIKLEWDHSSGNYGTGYMKILDGGKRLKGQWDSEGSGRFYGEWDLLRQ